MEQEPIIKKRPVKKKSPNRNLNLIIFVIIVLVLLIVIPYYLFLPGEKTFKLQQYSYARVEEKEFIRSIPATGKVMALRDVVVRAPAEGKVLKTFFKTGERVSKDQILLELNLEKMQEELSKKEALFREKINEKETRTLEYDQEIKQLENKIKDYKDQHKKLKDEFPTWEKLFDLGEISLSSLEEKRAKIKETSSLLEETKNKKDFTLKKRELDLITVDSSLDNLKREIDDIKEKLAQRQIRVKITGKLVELNVEFGDEIEEDEILAVIIDEESLIVSAEVDLDDIKFVQEEQDVRIDVAGETYEGKVENISAVAEGDIVKARVKFNEFPEDLRIQTEVSLDIVIDRLKDRLALPRGRYLTSGQEIYVYKIADKKAVKTEVRFGLINGDYIEVREGLEKGDRVITDSYDSFIEHDEIEVNPEGGIKI